jgi:hypothetical protein
LRTKGGKEKEFPVHHQLEEILDSYVEESGLRTMPLGLYFRRRSASPESSVPNR